MYNADIIAWWYYDAIGMDLIIENTQRSATESSILAGLGLWETRYLLGMGKWTSGRAAK